jgi:hypothetical protein
VVALTLAVFVGAEFAAPAPTLTDRLIVRVVPAPTVPSEHVIDPPDPAPGVHPLVVLASVKPAGRTSVTATSDASLGPWLVITSE